MGCMGAEDPAIFSAGPLGFPDRNSYIVAPFQGKKTMKAPVVAALGAAGLVVLAGAVDTGSFYFRAAQLEQSWRSAEAAGVPAASLQPARRELRQLETRWSGPLPYATLSGAAVRDPFTQPRALGDQGRAAALSSARARAETALQHLRDVSGPNDTGQY